VGIFIFWRSNAMGKVVRIIDLVKNFTFQVNQRDANPIKPPPLVDSEKAFQCRYSAGNLNFALLFASY